MKSFFQYINEAIQNNSNIKNKIKKFQLELENKFGTKIYNKSFNYDINIDDLYDFFDIANIYFFNSKLSKDTLEIKIINGNRKEKGTFKTGRDVNDKDLIGIVKYDKDNFFQILNVFLHEMIHLYDSKFGPLYKYINAYDVMNTKTNKQFVGSYDAHGKYFKQFCEKINRYGFIVKDKYSISDKQYMKKLKEQKTKQIAETFFADESNDEHFKNVKQIYDSLTNCNKDMVYRDKDHWYIQID